MESDPSSFSINHNYYLLVTLSVICATPSFTTYCIRHSLLLHYPSIYIFILLLVSTGQYCDIFNLLHKKKQNNAVTKKKALTQNKKVVDIYLVTILKKIQYDKAKNANSDTCVIFNYLSYRTECTYKVLIFKST
jgi:hypothetical protein